MGCKSTKNKQQGFEELCIRALKDAGCRVTNPRLAVIRCLGSAKKPLTAPEVFTQIEREKKKRAGGAADKVSVYRTLQTLNELKLIHQVMPTGAYIACSHHDCVDSYHVLSRCQNCDRVEELGVPSEVVAPLLFHLQNTNRFTPDSHLLHMEGHCSSCSMQEKVFRG